MEIRCEECGHLGEAGEVRPVDDGVGLVCSSCEHVNLVAAGESDDGDGSPDGAVDASSGESNPGWKSQLASMPLMSSTDTGETGPRPTLDVDEGFVENSMDRLVPEPGDGARCRKCFHLLDDDEEHCARCGLEVIEANAYDDGQAPWEKPPEGKEDDYAEAEQLWQRVEGRDAEAIDAFVDFAVDAGLVDHGIRRLQEHLVEYPDDAAAIRGLSRLAKQLRVAIEVARTQVASEAENFTEDVRRFRSGILVGALVFWTAILLLFSWLFWDFF